MSDTTTETSLEQQLAEAEQRGHLAGVQATSALWQADVALMNDILNERADEADLCSRYEDALDYVNARCSMIQLQGRSRSYTASITLSVDYEAGAHDASDRADEIAEALARHGDNLGYQTYTVNGADVNDTYAN